MHVYKIYTKQLISGAERSSEKCTTTIVICLQTRFIAVTNQRLCPQKADCLEPPLKLFCSLQFFRWWRFRICACVFYDSCRKPISCRNCSTAETPQAVPC